MLKKLLFNTQNVLQQQKQVSSYIKSEFIHQKIINIMYF